MRARALHLAACKAARPDPVALARDLFARETESDWDWFAGSLTAYRDVLGEAGLAEYRRLAQDAWAKVGPGDHHPLAAIVDSLVAMDGDVDARVAIRVKTLSSAYNHLQLAEFYVAQGREAEALRWAEEGVWRFEDQPDERLTTFTANLYDRAGRTPEALALLWRNFERRPSLDLYQRLKGLAADPTVVRDRAVDTLTARLANAGKPTVWSAPTDLLIRLLMGEGLFDRAWETVRAHGATGGPAGGPGRRQPRPPPARGAGGLCPEGRPAGGGRR